MMKSGIVNNEHTVSKQEAMVRTFQTLGLVCALAIYGIIIYDIVTDKRIEMAFRAKDRKIRKNSAKIHPINDETPQTDI